ncbi:MAG: tetratricopeptide repeat protein, partial [Pseudomonadota bacterium]
AGEPDQAEACFRRALDEEPDFVQAHVQRAVALTDLNRLPEAIEAFRRALDLDPNDLEVSFNLSKTYFAAGDPMAAIEQARRTVEIDPTQPVSNIYLTNLIDEVVSDWHVPMMNDSHRNDAYQAAFERAIGPDTRVLEIGTGGGLLALLAARCGARTVTTCETVTALAETASKIVAANGYEDRVTVVPKHSTDLEVGADLAEPADLMISEILSNEFLYEGVIPSLTDAKRRLLKPGGQIIPAAGTIKIALLGGEAVTPYLRVDEVCGFDMRVFNTVVSRKKIMPAKYFDGELLSDETPAFTFDFVTMDDIAPGKKILRLPVRKSGLCYGIIQWFHLQMDEETEFENHPTVETPATSWTYPVYLFDDPIEVEDGQRAVVTATHNRLAPWFHLDAIEST